jgi:hypothetical protein
VPRVKHAMNEPRYSKTELKVQAIVKRRADGQLMRVPWPRFRKAYEEYPRWQALVLWVHAIVATHHGIPSWLVTDLQERCPGFIEHEALTPEPKLVDLGLLEWVHNQEFGYAKRQGWLDALTFYGVRHPRSECAWAYWERCESQWSKDQPNTLPTFDEWWQKAQHMMLRDKISYRDVGKAVEKCLDSEALILWLRPLFVSNVKLPPHVTPKVKRRCPGIMEFQKSGTHRSGKENSKIWRHLNEWRQDQYLSDAKEDGWLDFLLQRARSHPLHMRLVVYGNHWAKAWPRNRPQTYPSFRQWRRAADRYILAGQN